MEAENGHPTTSQLSVSQPINGYPADSQLSVSQPIYDLLQTKKWLDSQLHFQAAESLSDEIELSRETDIVKLTQSISDLQEELISETSRLNIQELILKRLQLGHELESQLFGTLGGSHVTSVSVNSKLAFEKLAKRQTELVSQIMKKQQVYFEKKKYLTANKQKNNEIMKQNRELFHCLQQQQNKMKQKFKDFSTDVEAQSQLKRLEMLTTNIEILRHTLQGLIFGSGLNWAQDPEMEALVTSLGVPTEL